MMRFPRAALVLWFSVLAAGPALDAQPTVDDVLARLATIGGGSLADWRFRLGDLENGAAPDLDDSGWAAVSPEHRWAGENRNAWYRRVVVIPEHAGGFAVAGSRVWVRLGVDDYGEIWVNGEKRCDFDWDRGEVTLTDKARPGERFLVAVLARNRGGPGRLLFARLETSAGERFRDRAAAFTEALGLARAIVEKFGGPERRGRDALAAAASAVDFAALEAADGDRFLASLETATRRLSALRELTREYAVFAAGYSHIDLAWLWRWVESIQVCRETFQSALGFFEEFPGFRFSMSQSHAHRWMEQRYPELFAAIRKAVREGRWEIVGGTSVEADCNLPGAESHIRQLLIGKRYFLEKFGRDVRIGWCPDSFGYNVNLPQILKKAGVDYFVTAKISWNDTNEFPYNLFWWEAPDGSRVLTCLPMGGYTFDLDGHKMLDHLVRISKQPGAPKRILSVYGVGNHGGGPTRAMLERGTRLAGLDFFPRFTMSSALEFFESFREDERAALAVWKDELYLEYHRGTYTTQAAVKKANRQGECGLMTAEKLASVGRHLGRPYPAEALGRAWDLLVFNQMHDILPGSSITPVYRDARRDYNRMRAAYRRVQRDGLDALASAIDTRGLAAGTPVVVFNPLSWPRDDVVELALREDEDAPAYEIVDADGAPQPTQLVVDPETRERTVLFLAAGVPSHGYRTYALRPRGHEHPAVATPLRAGPTWLENAMLRARLDPETGNLVSLLHRPTGREALGENAAANRIQLFEDRPDRYDAWNLKFTGKQWDLDTVKSLRLVETGPVRAVIRVERTFLGPGKRRRHPTEDFPSSFFVQDIILEHGVPRLEVRLTADWWEDHLCAKVAFPLAVDPKVATYEAPYAHIERSTRRETSWEKARYEVSMQKWADLSADGFGVSLLNDSKYGCDTLHNRIRLTLLRSPTSPDPLADRGRHETVYALYPHAGDWRQGLTVRQGYELNYPLHVCRAPRTAGDLPAAGRSLLTVDAPNVVVPVWKKHEDSEAHVVRLYEWEGRDATEATLTFVFPVARAWRIDLLERERTPLPVEDGTVKIRLGRYAIETVLVEPGDR
jgi:alpha-mannosidase